MQGGASKSPRSPAAAIAAALLSLSVLCFTTPVEAQSPHQRISGTVENVASSVLTVRTADGHLVAILLLGHEAHVLRVGARVVIDAERVGKNLVAHHIEAAPAAAGRMHPGRSAVTTATTVPQHAGHDTTPPQQAGHESSPQHAGHQTTTPEHAGHETTPPEEAGAEGTSPQHEGHQMPGMGSGTAQHLMGTMGGSMEPPSRALFQSDMTTMAGMTPEDRMAGMAMKAWAWMDLGIGRLGFNHQDGPSGRDAVESSNWNMIMFQKDVLGGRATLMMMNSLEPVTLRKSGSPELFQTGETYNGQPLVDGSIPMTCS